MIYLNLRSKTPSVREGIQSVAPKGAKIKGMSNGKNLRCLTIVLNDLPPGGCQLFQKEPLRVEGVELKYERCNACKRTT